MKRAEVLGTFMRGRQGIAMAVIVRRVQRPWFQVLTVAGLDPTTVLGG